MKRRVTPAELDEKETDADARTPLDSDRDTPSGRVPRVCTRVRVRVHPVRHGPALQETACCAVGPVRRRWAFSGFCFCSWGPCECSSSLSKSGARRERAAGGAVSRGLRPPRALQVVGKDTRWRSGDPITLRSHTLFASSPAGPSSGDFSLTPGLFVS